MSPTSFEFVPIRNFDILSELHGVPHGELFHVSVNPYTGIAVICYQNNPVARAYLDQILFQLVSSGYFADRPRVEVS